MVDQCLAENDGFYIFSGIPTLKFRTFGKAVGFSIASYLLPLPIKEMLPKFEGSKISQFFVQTAWCKKKTPPPPKSFNGHRFV